MKNLTLLFAGVFVGLILFFTTEAVMSQDVIQVAPEQFKVLLENEHVRVLEFKMKPGDVQEMHTHPATVHIEMTPTKVKITNPEGKAFEVEGKEGEVIWVGPVKHTVENTGDNEISGYIVELKSVPYEADGK